MFTDNAVRDSASASDKLLGMNLLSKENTVVLLQYRSVLPDTSEALSPFAVANANR